MINAYENMKNNREFMISIKDAVLELLSKIG